MVYLYNNYNMPKLIWMKDTEDEQLKLCKFNDVVCSNDCGSHCFYEFVVNIIELINHDASSIIANYIFTDNFWEVLVDDDKICDIFDKGILESVDKLTFEECHKHICNIGLLNFLKIIDEYYIYNQKERITLQKLQEMNNIKDIQMLLYIYVNKCIMFCNHIENISDELVEPINEFIHVAEARPVTEPVTAIHVKPKIAEENTTVQCKEPILLDNNLMQKKKKQTLEPKHITDVEKDVAKFINKVKNTPSTHVYCKIFLRDNSNDIAKCIYAKIKNIRNTNKDWLIRSTHGYIFNHLELPLYEKKDLEKVIYEYGIQKAIQNFIINKKHYEHIVDIVDSDMSKIYLGLAYYIICESFEIMSFIGNE